MGELSQSTLLKIAYEQGFERNVQAINRVANAIAELSGKIDSTNDTLVNIVALLTTRFNALEEKLMAGFADDQTALTNLETSFGTLATDLNAGLAKITAEMNAFESAPSDADFAALKDRMNTLAASASALDANFKAAITPTPAPTTPFVPAQPLPSLTPDPTPIIVTPDPTAPVTPDPVVPTPAPTDPTTPATPVVPDPTPTPDPAPTTTPAPAVPVTPADGTGTPS